MADTKSALATESVTTEPEGLSALSARILNQLSLSAWLPAAFLTLSVTFLIQFRSMGRVDVPEAAVRLTDKDQIWGVAILAVPVLVVATLITQAFAFEAIRILEGYWHRAGPAIWIASGLIRFQVWRKNWLKSAARARSHKAFLESRARWLVDTAPEIVNALELASLGRDYPEELDDLVGDADWTDRCRPWAIRRVEGFEISAGEFPVESRTLPTRLGNVLRAAEDELQHTDGDLATFVMNRRSLLPPSVRTQHDQFRTRIEMYSILVFVALIVAVSALAILWSIRGIEVAFICGGSALIAFTSYHAAIASARGYVVILRQMDRA